MSDVSKTNEALIAEAQEHYSEMNGLNSRAAEVMMELVAALESATRVPEQGEASAAIGRVRAIHKREVIAVHPGIGEEAWCPACQEHWPCSTTTALDGAPEPEWEYGEIGPANQVHMTTPERVRKSEALGWSQEIVRRYTAGPWVSVKVGDIGE